jgi:hypothetical protein
MVAGLVLGKHDRIIDSPSPLIGKAAGRLNTVEPGFARYFATNVLGVFVFSQTLIDHLSQQVVVGPGQEFDLGYQLGPYPMHATQYQRCPQAVGSRRWRVERHFVGSKRL